MYIKFLNGYILGIFYINALIVVKLLSLIFCIFSCHVAILCYYIVAQVLTFISHIWSAYNASDNLEECIENYSWVIKFFSIILPLYRYIFMEKKLYT